MSETKFHTHTDGKDSKYIFVLLEPFRQEKNVHISDREFRRMFGYGSLFSLSSDKDTILHVVEGKS
jgi:hypothetical protein